jgi:hypothetical protein
MFGKGDLNIAKRPEVRLKISLSKKGKKFSDEHKHKLRLAKLGTKQSPKTIEKRFINCRGEKHYNWQGGKSNNRYIHSLNNKEYREWRTKVFTRDNFKCKINNCDCKGQLEAHHILSWRDYPELRYDINNGITLCHFHHPRGRNNEIKLIQTFNGLVMQTN